MTRVADVLGELSDEDVEWIVCAGERREVTQGSPLIVEGELPSALFMVLEGELSVVSAPGRQVRRLTSGDVAGEVSIADAGTASATVRATSDAVVFAIPRASLEAKLALDAGFAARFYRAMSVFLAYRLRNPWSDERAVATASEGAENPFLKNVHLAAARSERLLRRLHGDSVADADGQRSVDRVRGSRCLRPGAGGCRSVSDGAGRSVGGRRQRTGPRAGSSVRAQIPALGRSQANWSRARTISVFSRTFC